jgi:cytidine deaminase
MILEKAREASGKSYSPYSNFRVGAALLCDDGEIFVGTNVENRSFGLTNCAERSAVFAAVSAGKKNWVAMAIYSPDATDPLPPCGACRQVISEFAASDFEVLMSNRAGVSKALLSELLPFDSLHKLKG